MQCRHTNMNYRALTISREYGSGGAEIARIVADRLGWKLLDDAILAEISRRAKVPVTDAAALDERVDPWLHRLTRPLWGKGGDGMSPIELVNLFDADAEAALARTVIEEAARIGSCVVVGRGAQCIFRDRDDVFRVFVYACWADRIRRVAARVEPGPHVDELILETDERRQGYVRRNYRQDPLDPHLYNLMVDSADQPGAVAAVIMSAMESIQPRPNHL